MSKKVYALASGVLGGVAAVASAVVAFMAPPMSPAIIAAIGIGVKAVDEIMLLFVKEDK